MSNTSSVTSKPTMSIISVDATPSSAADSIQMPADATAQLLKLQLDSTDQQISKIENKMQNQDALNTDLGDMNQFFSQYAQGVTDQPNPTNGAQYLDAQDIQTYRDTGDAKIDQAIQAAGGPTSSYGKTLVSMKQSFDSTFGTNGNSSDTTSTKGADNEWSVTDISNMSQSIKNVQQSVNTDSQMDMIDLQSLMSQRQTFIQMSTNVKQSQDDATKSIAENIGK